MKKFSKILLCFVLLCQILIAASAANAVPQKVISATESVVRILAKYSDGYATGTGFVIKCDMDEILIVTNHHVVEDNPYNISVWISEEELIQAEILAFSSQKDLCVLKLSHSVNLNPVKISAEAAKQGDAIYAVGFPSAADYLSDTDAHTSHDATITDGIVSALREATPSQYGVPVSILQISAAINAGNSGGPLFNADGQVVGINTYGIVDAQGIFGAINISEVLDFLKENNIKVASGTPLSIVLVIVTCAVLLCITVLLIRSRKKKSPRAKQKKQIVSLRSFMQAYPQGLGIPNAVSLLMPVALQLRDMHNNGTAHLQVSPDSIMVSTTANLRAPTEAEADRYTSGFAAREIYSGISKGALSDVYSFCAVLYYTAFGEIPANALQRETDPICTPAEDSFTRIINQGTQILPEERFDSIQSIILKLSEYNVQPFVAQTPAAPVENPKKKRQKKLSAPVRILVAGTAVIILVVGGYFASYGGAYYYAGKADFHTADQLLFAPQITQLHDPLLLKYIEAGKLFEDKDYIAAKARFLSIPDYLQASTMALESDYCHAAYLANTNQFPNALGIYHDLATSEYKDSKDKLDETRYRHVLYILYEKKDYLTAYKMLSKSEYKGIDNITSILNDTKELLYNEAVRYYRDGELGYAKLRFIEGYKDSDKYLLLINTKNSSLWYTDLDGNLKKLKDLFYFEDTPVVLLSNQGIAEAFLQGTWKTSNKSKHFTMKSDGSITYTLPASNYGDYYNIKDGNLFFYPKNKPSDKRKIFTFTATSPDSIEVYCYKDGKTYTLYRQ